MDASLLIKSLPMLIMLASLAWATYTVEQLGSTPAPNRVAARQATAKRATAGSALNRVEDVAASIREVGRDLFRTLSDSAAPGDDGSSASPSPRPESDPMLDVIGQLTLNATLIQGRNQLAVISGKTYAAGQPIKDSNGEPLGVSLTKVFADKVVLQGESRHYVLAYPSNLQLPAAARTERRPDDDLARLREFDPQLALFQTLLRSPLGGLGARLLGASAARMAPITGSQAAGGRPVMPRASSGLQAPPDSSP